MIKIGDRVTVNNRVGSVRFIGNTSFAKGIWYGIELDLPEGKNNGTINDVKYFETDANHGVFVKLPFVKKLEGDSTVISEESQKEQKLEIIIELLQDKIYNYNIENSQLKEQIQKLTIKIESQNSSDQVIGSLSNETDSLRLKFEDLKNQLEAYKDQIQKNENFQHLYENILKQNEVLKNENAQQLKQLNNITPRKIKQTISVPNENELYQTQTLKYRSELLLNVFLSNDISYVNANILENFFKFMYNYLNETSNIFPSENTVNKLQFEFYFQFLIFFYNYINIMSQSKIIDESNALELICLNEYTNLEIFYKSIELEKKFHEIIIYLDNHNIINQNWSFLQKILNYLIKIYLPNLLNIGIKNYDNDFIQEFLKLFNIEIPKNLSQLKNNNSYVDNSYCMAEFFKITDILEVLFSNDLQIIFEYFQKLSHQLLNVELEEISNTTLSNFDNQIVINDIDENIAMYKNQIEELTIQLNEKDEVIQQLQLNKRLYQSIKRDNNQNVLEINKLNRQLQETIEMNKNLNNKVEKSQTLENSLKDQINKLKYHKYQIIPTEVDSQTLREIQRIDTAEQLLTLRKIFIRRSQKKMADTTLIELSRLSWLDEPKYHPVLKSNNNKNNALLNQFHDLSKTMDNYLESSNDNTTINTQLYNVLDAFRTNNVSK
ncbi:hypothetical protein TBLA_0B03680 [Henningerozyma blattae CBS 6284]|uniref:CAP-Gly domain-containing protein n=1 Tax=Henningerozyma blattae (strain ATCC 34711 / CBS 6284 / DSM 70876 / NBRC 10599 / NRRL Y-10934 / UCD 77-7) TaxID=1071380 RepID=I2GYK5_HENB6|nr:hypothetical protein TBLA_0B03680 [Tetrapisispora blattae CBS 6284]CCH59207.1 hypothetical protein TBLA_0B03680 [Tetrapisispora blattae CBS 6284]